MTPPWSQKYATGSILGAARESQGGKPCMSFNTSFASTWDLYSSTLTASPALPAHRLGASLRHLLASIHLLLLSTFIFILRELLQKSSAHSFLHLLYIKSSSRWWGAVDVLIVSIGNEYPRFTTLY